MPTNNVLAIAFDLDGTAVKSLGASHMLLVDGSREFNIYPPSIMETRYLIQNLTLRQIAKCLLGSRHNNDEGADDFVKWIHKNYLDYNRRYTALVPGVADCFQKLLGMGYRISIVSNNDRENVLNVIRDFDLQCYFSNIVTASDVARIKPDPQMILESAARMSVSPAEMVVVGDSPVDAQAAFRAGSLFYGVLSGLSDEERLLSAGARNVFPTVCSIMSELSRN